jgi:hypothetical protein
MIKAVVGDVFRQVLNLLEQAYQIGADKPPPEKDLR